MSGTDPTMPLKTPSPVYDLFLSVSHPASSSPVKPILISPPTGNTDPVIRELSSPQSVTRISRFAFPEFSDEVHGREQSQNTTVGNGAGLNKHDVYCDKFQAESFVFCLQVASGDRVRGHLYRYLPPREDCDGRLDVGRRGVRCLIILTRREGGNGFYLGLLKSLHGLSLSSQPDPQWETWLHSIHRIPSDEILSLPNLEFSGSRMCSSSLNFFPPHTVCAPLLPLLRVMGVHQTLRLLSALLTERRIVMTSTSPSLLSQCCQAAISILQSGTLTFPHIYIPILPPGLQAHLGAPVPYLIGVLSFRYDSTMGEIVALDLDGGTLDAYGIPNVHSAVPDLLRGSLSEQSAQGSIAESLAKDLTDILQKDNTAFISLDAGAVLQRKVKKVKGVTRAIGKFINRGETNKPKAEEAKPEEELKWEDYGHNATMEEETRIAFCSFFLCLLGDWGWYLSSRPPQNTPLFDPQKFITERKRRGEGPGSPMLPLISSFVRSSLMDIFVRERIREITTRQFLQNGLFQLTVSHHRKQRIDFSPHNVRRTIRQLSNKVLGRSFLERGESIKRLAMAITSKQVFQGDQQAAVSKIMEECHEVTYILPEVFGVIWYRLRDSKGGQWRHAMQGLMLLRNLVLHGPNAAISETLGYSERVRKLTTYTGNKANGSQIRKAASQVYQMIVSYKRLAAMRKVCMVRRYELTQKKVRKRRLEGLSMRMPFSKVHRMVKPIGELVQTQDLLNWQGGDDVNNAVSQQIQQSVTTHQRQKQQAYANDLLAFDFMDSPPPVVNNDSASSGELFGFAPQHTHASQTPPNQMSSPDPFSPPQPVNDNISPSANATNTHIANPMEPRPVLINANPNSFGSERFKSSVTTNNHAPKLAHSPQTKQSVFAANIEENVFAPTATTRNSIPATRNSIQGHDDINVFAPAPTAPNPARTQQFARTAPTHNHVNVFAPTPTTPSPAQSQPQPPQSDPYNFQELFSPAPQTTAQRRSCSDSVLPSISSMSLHKPIPQSSPGIQPSSSLTTPSHPNPNYPYNAHHDKPHGYPQTMHQGTQPSQPPPSTNRKQAFQNQNRSNSMQQINYSNPSAANAVMNSQKSPPPSNTTHNQGRDLNSAHPQHNRAQMYQQRTSTSSFNSTSSNSLNTNPVTYHQQPNLLQNQTKFTAMQQSGTSTHPPAQNASQPQPYPPVNNWTNQYPPNITPNSNHPPSAASPQQNPYTNTNAQPYPHPQGTNTGSRGASAPLNLQQPSSSQRSYTFPNAQLPNQHYPQQQQQPMQHHQQQQKQQHTPNYYQSPPGQTSNGTKQSPYPHQSYQQNKGATKQLPAAPPQANNPFAQFDPFSK